MKIEVGKYYKQRDGKIVGPMQARDSIYYPFKDATNFWTEEGHFYVSEHPSDKDLVEEVLANWRIADVRIYSMATPGGYLAARLLENEREWEMPEGRAERKAIPVFSGAYGYFPDALMAVEAHVGAEQFTIEGVNRLFKQYAKDQSLDTLLELTDQVLFLLDGATLNQSAYFNAYCRISAISYAANEQHNPGQPMHWARGKSTDQMDAAARHWGEYCAGKRQDAAGLDILAQAGWRLCAELQLKIEKQEGYSK